MALALALALDQTKASLTPRVGISWFLRLSVDLDLRLSPYHDASRSCSRSDFDKSPGTSGVLMCNQGGGHDHLLDSKT